MILTKTSASRLTVRLTLTLGLSFTALNPALADKLRFAVGPLQPTAGDTRKAFEPFFASLAHELNSDYQLVVTTDWAGVATALANGQADVAWMGPWGYVLAHNEAAAQAIAMVKYDGKPIYHAIIVARPDLVISKFPEDAKGLSISFADQGSTSGWLVPTFWFQSQGINPKTYFKYRDGSTHPANEIAVANGQVDLATDYDRNYNAMVERGLIKPEQVKIVWTSDPLPNDALAVRKDLDPALIAKISGIVTGLTDEQAKAIMPAHYTGWIPASHAQYQSIEDAGIAVGKIHKTAAQ